MSIKPQQKLHKTTRSNKTKIQVKRYIDMYISEHHITCYSFMGVTIHLSNIFPPHINMLHFSISMYRVFLVKRLVCVKFKAH